MDAFSIILLVVVIVGFAAVFWLLKGQKQEPEKDDQSFLMLQSQMNKIEQVLDSKLSQAANESRHAVSEVGRVMQQQFGQSAKIIQEITRELTSVREGQKQVVNVTDQLKNLQDALTNTKQRGILGEYSLEVILQNFFPHNYQRQYEFKDGSKVDFVLKFRDKIIPIDAKFSLENYQRILETKDEEQRKKLEETFKGDLKRRIDETAKYIKPQEGTTEFAFMFIPAEAVYYDLLINKIGTLKSNTRDLIEYAMGEKKVTIVSPTSFLAYLQTVLQGLKALQIEESAKEIRKNVEALMKHLLAYESSFNKLGKHLETSINMYNSAGGEFKRIDKDIFKITGKEMGIEPRLLEKPEVDESD